MTKQAAIRRRELLGLAGLAGLGGLGLALPEPAVAMPRRRSERQIVMLDPGHGGVDPGCIGTRGTYEKYIAFATAYEVAKRLEATGRYTPHLTRYDDVFIPLHQRVIKAQAVNASIFLSIHADSIPDDRLRGASIFTLSDTASDRLAAALATRENDSDSIGGIRLDSESPEVDSILVDLARREATNMSQILARQLVLNLGHQVRLLDHCHRSAGFAVLKAPDIPSALVEIGCLSNADEEAELRIDSYRRKVAVGVVRSIDGYFGSVTST